MPLHRNVPATGRLFEFRFVVIVSFRDELMFGERFYYSLDDLLEPLGVKPHSQYRSEAADISSTDH